MKTRSVRPWLGGLALLAASALPSCYDLDLFEGSSGGSNIHAPVQLGGLPPVDGTDQLDATFATAGMFDAVGFPERSATRVVADGQARPLVVGFSPFPDGLRVLRLTESGASDPTFGTNGAFFLPQALGAAVDPLRPPDCVLDASGRILLLHTARAAVNLDRAFLVRLEPDGALDLTFGEQGKVVLEPSPGATETFGVSLALDAANGILVCADESGPLGRRVIVARLLEDGTLDDTFGVSGIARGPEVEESRGARLLVDPAGGAVVAGTLPAEPGRVALWRFDAEGSLDLDFGDGGLVASSDPLMALDLAAVDAARDASGRIYLLANRSTDLAEIDDWPTQLVDFKTSAPPVFDAIVWRFLAEGALDASFADAGARILAFNSGPYISVSGGFKGGDHLDAATGLFVDAQERLVVAGSSQQGIWDTSIGWATFDFPTTPFLMRLTSSGALDASFHGVGHAEIGSDPSAGTTVFPHGRPTSLASDPAGRWLLAGNATTGSPQRVWRLAP